MKFILTYGRTVILERGIEAESEEEAWEIALNLEKDNGLGLSGCTSKLGSVIANISDCDVIWDLEEIK